MFQQQNPPPGEGWDNPQQNDHLPWHRRLLGSIQAAADDLVQGTITAETLEDSSTSCGALVANHSVSPVRSVRRLNGGAPSQPTPHTSGYLRWRRVTGEITPANYSTDPGWCGERHNWKSQVGCDITGGLFRNATYCNTGDRDVGGRGVCFPFETTSHFCPQSSQCIKTQPKKMLNYFTSCLWMWGLLIELTGLANFSTQPQCKTTFWTENQQSD